MFWFIVFLLMVGAVFYMYQNLKTMEKEIREEQLRAKEMSRQQKDTEVKATPEPKTAVTVEEMPADPQKNPEPAEAAVEKNDDSEVSMQVKDDSTEEGNEIISLIKANPGIKQTELYAKVTSMTTKQAQQSLKKMADAGEIKREKVGSSYKLFL